MKSVMCIRTAFVLLVAFLTGCRSLPVENVSITIDDDELAGHVRFLADPAMKGRKAGSWEAAAARSYIKSRFTRYGLSPWPNTKSYEQSFGFGKNVIGIMPGTDPNLAGQIILVSAHYDHIGVANGKIHPGACDNASGVAALLEIAETISLMPERPARTICFASFDAEEKGCLGAFAFTCRQDFDDLKIAAVVNIDLLGRDFLDIVENSVLLLGAEEYPALQKQIIRSGQAADIRVLPFRAQMVVPTGDHIAFLRPNRPNLFFTCGLYTDYHQPTDTVERLNIEKTRKETSVVLDTVLCLANSDTIDPPYMAENHSTESLASLAFVLEQIASARETLGLDPNQINTLNELLAQAQSNLNEKRLTEEQLVEFERKTVNGLVKVLAPTNRTLAQYGHDFIEMGKYYWQYPYALTRAFREIIRQGLEKPPSLFGKTTYQHTEELPAMWALKDTGDGRYFLAVAPFSIKASALFSFLGQGELSVNVGGPIHCCKGTEKEITDFCLIMLLESGYQFTTTGKTAGQENSHQDIWLKVLNKIHPQANAKEVLQKRLDEDGLENINDWLLSLVDSENATLAMTSLRQALLHTGSEGQEKIIRIALDSNARPDVRAAAIGTVANASAGQKTLQALASLIDEKAVPYKKEHTMVLDEEFPLAMVLSDYDIMREAFEKWYDTNEAKETLSDMAVSKLKKLTGKNFGENKQKWKKWITENVKN